MQTGFIGGEISPLMAGRVETSHYAYGLKICENFVPFNEGPIVKRPGFFYICDADPSSTWLTPFKFNITQEYLLEWGQQKLRLYTNGGRIESAPGVPVEVATPYAASDAPMVSAVQSFDRQYQAHASYPPGALFRTGAIAFNWAPLALTDGPYADENSDLTTTLKVSMVNVGEAGTITASKPVFTAGMVGTLIRIDAQDFSVLPVWQPGAVGVVAGDKVRSDDKVYVAATSGTTGTDTPIHERGTEWDGQNRDDINGKGPYGVQWTFRSLSYGTATIAAVTDATHATAVVVRQFPDSLTTVPSSFFRLAAFRSDVGYPGLVFRWLGRLGFIQNYDLIASVSGDFLNFQIETSEEIETTDLAFTRRLDIENVPLWCIPDRKLLVGTATRELAVGPINAAVAVSAGNISADVQSKYGGQPVTPAEAGTTTIFIERGGRRIRASDYDFTRDRYDAPDLTATAMHITRGGVVQLTIQRTPQLMLAAVRGDGQIIKHPISRGELQAFSRVVLGGGARVLSATSIVAADGVTDELWLLVERVRGNGTTAREIWKQGKWRDIGDDPTLDFYVDGGVQISAAAGQAHFSGFTFMAGQTLVGLANGGVVPEIVVGDDGTFTLEAQYVPATGPYTLSVGLSYTATAITQTPPASTQSGPIQGIRMRWRRVVARVLETLGLKVGQDSDRLEELIDRSQFDDMDTAIPLFTGDTPGVVDTEIRRDGSMMFVSDIPKPATINAGIFTGEADDRDG
jgi:hypothetical protein